MINRQEVWIIDDEPSYSQAWEKKFEEKNVELKIFISGEMALEKLKHSKPDLVLLDVVLPGPSGFEVCHQIKKLSPNPPKIIMISGTADKSQRVLGYDSGADDFIGKDVHEKEIFSKLFVYLDIIRKQSELKEILKTLTVQLQEQEKLAFLGLHTAEIVHNLKSPLTVLKALCTKLKRLDPDSKLPTQLENVTKRMEDTVSSILYPVNRVVETTTNLNDVIKSELQLLQFDHFFRYEIELTLNLEPVPLMPGNPSDFRQIFGNLLQNAVHALFKAPEKKILIALNHDVNSQMNILTIKDSGHGIPENKLEEIFEPFITSKPKTSNGSEPTGTGLGLSFVKREVEKYSGFIELESTVGVGTSFTLKFPIKKETHLN